MSLALGRLGFGAGIAASLLLVLFPVYLLVMVSVAPGDAIFGERPDLVSPSRPSGSGSASSPGGTCGVPCSRA